MRDNETIRQWAADSLCSGFGDDLSSEQCSAVIRKVMGIELPWCDVVEIATNGVEHRANTVHFPHFLRNYEDFAVIRGQQSIEGAHMYKKQQQLQVEHALDCLSIPQVYIN